MSSSLRIGFISTRFAGTDGVSLETAKWAAALERMGHECFYFCGVCDRPAERSFIIPEAFYLHPAIDAITKAVYAGPWGRLHEGEEGLKDLHQDYFSPFIRPAQVSRQVEALKAHLKQGLYEFARKFELHVLITENALTIPINIPLGLAITEFIAETGYPTIAHHHDFYWERQRFLTSSVQDYLAAAFPPNLPSIRHAVINTAQARQLTARLGVPAAVVPNVMDFDNPPPDPGDYIDTLRADFGVADGRLLILQPTRIIQRKGIEHAIELVRRLGLPADLVITHAAGDEGYDYELRLREFAGLLGVNVHFSAELVAPQRGALADGRKVYELGDVYAKADLVTYPSLIEGFGNAFLEAVYYKRPLVVNNYAIYQADIKPKGFGVIEFDGYISEKTLEAARFYLAHPEHVQETCERNYALAQKYFSFTVLERSLGRLLGEWLAMD